MPVYMLTCANETTPQPSHKLIKQNHDLETLANGKNEKKTCKKRVNM